MRHPYLPFFPEKFFADTAHVPGDVAGYYVILLAHAWARGGSLPDDDVQLRLMTRCHHNRWPQIRAMLRSFWFIGDDGRLHQKRLDREWKRAETWRQNQGKASPSGRGERDTSRVSALQHKGIKPNENNATPPKPTRARALTHTPQHKEEEEARDARGRALTRDASPGFKNGRGRGKRHGQNREPSSADIAWRNLEQFERDAAK